MKPTFIALLALCLCLPVLRADDVDTLKEWVEQYTRIQKGEKLKRPFIFRQDNKAIRKEFVEYLNMMGLEAVHSGAGGLPKDKKKWMIGRMVWAAGNTLFMVNPSDLVRTDPEVTVNLWKKGLDTARKDEGNKIPPKEKFVFDFALMYFDRLTFLRKANPFGPNSKLIKTVLPLKYGDARDEIKPHGLEIETFEGWVEDYVRIKKGINLEGSFIFKQDNKAIRKDYIETINMAGLKSFHPDGLPPDKKDWRVPRAVWAEGNHLFTVNPTDLKEVDHEGTIKMWKEGLDASRKDKDGKIPREKKLYFDFVLFYFDKLTIISSKAPYNLKLRDNVTELSLEFGDGRDKIRPGLRVEKEKQLPKDLKSLKALAEKGDARAQLTLGELYRTGESVKKDFKEAEKWIRKSAEQKIAHAQFLLGAMYDAGKGVEKNEKEALVWYRKAAEQGHLRAQASLGRMYYLGIGGEEDFKEAAKWIRKAAVQGDDKSQYIYGHLHKEGRGVPQNLKEALRWFMISSTKRNAKAQLEAGMLILTGKGTEPSVEFAYSLFKAAAINGEPKAEKILEVVVKRMTPEQIAEGERLFKETRKKFNVAPPDEASKPEKPLPKDFKSLKALAEKGDVRAQFEMGQAYRRGEGVPKDNGKAAKWYHMAAEKGSVDGTYYLGMMYLNGDGVDKDLIRAYVNLSIAAEKKNAKAIKVKQIVANRMTPKQILTGDALLKNPERRTHFKFQPDCMAALIKSVGLDWVKKHPVGFEVGDPKGSMIDFVDKDSGLRQSWATVKLANGDELYISSAGGILIKDGRNAAFAKQVFRANVKDSARVAINLHQNRVIGYQTPLGMTDFLLTVFTQTALQSDSRKQYLERINRIAEVVVKEAMPFPKNLEGMKNKAEKGNVDSQWLLGLFYYGGNAGLKKDFREAANWYRKAALQGNVKAMEGLALIYRLGGFGLKADIVESTKWTRKSAERGDANGQLMLGMLFIDPPKRGGLPANNKELLKWAPKNNEEAVGWVRKAAVQGHVIAQYNLGRIYFDGKLVPKDFKEALKWFGKAAEQGWTDAQANLGAMYFNGDGVKRDLVKAYAWNTVAGDAKSKRFRDLAAKRMAPRQIAEAKELSRQLFKMIAANRK